MQLLIENTWLRSVHITLEQAWEEANVSGGGQSLTAQLEAGQVKLLRVMAPLLDMFNHGPGSGSGSGSASGALGSDVLSTVSFHRTARFARTDGPVVRLTLGQPVSKGEQCFISYGERCSDDFVAYYGFCPTENPHDTVEVTVGEGELGAFLGQSPEAQFELGGRADVNELEAVLQAIAPAAAADPDSEAEAEAEVVARAARLLADRLAEALDEYPTTIEEDEVAIEEAVAASSSCFEEGAAARRNEWEGRAMLRRLRLNKKRILKDHEAALRSLARRAGQGSRVLVGEG